MKFISLYILTFCQISCLSLSSQAKISVENKNKAAPMQQKEKAMQKVSIVRVNVKDFPAWNSSYEHQRELDQNPLSHAVYMWELTAENPEFAKLAQRVMSEAKINNEHSLISFFGDEVQVKRNELWDEKPTGASPAHTTIYVEFSNGKSYEIGEYPFYSLSKPFDELVALTRRVSKRSVYDPKTGKATAL